MLKKMSLISISSVLFLSACASGVPKPPPARGSIYYQVEQLGEMEYLEVTNMQASKRNGLLHVQAEVFNKDSDNQQLYYRFKWLDDSGFVIGGEEAWKPALIYGQQKKVLKGIAPTGAVTDFKLVVQSPDNVVD